MFNSLHELMRLKQELIGAHGLDSGFFKYKQVTQQPDAVLEFRRLASLREFSARQGAFFLETAVAGAAFLVKHPCIVGAGHRENLQGKTRSQFVACLVEAQVRGRSKLVECGGLAVLDFQDDEVKRSSDQLHFDPAVFSAVSGGVWVIATRRSAPTIQVAEAFMSLAGDSHNFGDWMWSYLPRYIAALGTGQVPRMPILLDESVPASILEAIELMAPECSGIVKLPAFSTARVAKLWCGATPCYMTLHESEETEQQILRAGYSAAEPERLGLVIREMAKRVNRVVNASTGTHKVYLARRPHLHRKLSNAEAIESIMRASGFAIIYPEELSFAEQVRTVRRASFVAGPDGSAIYLAYFCAPGTRVCILSNTNTLRAQVMETAFLEAIDVDVTVFTGSLPAGDEAGADDYVIDEVHLDGFLARWIG